MDIDPIVVTHTDFAWQEAFMRYIPRVFPLSFRRWHELGGWDENYCAIAIMQGDDIIANASLQRMTIVLHGRELRGWQLGAVGVVPEHRGKGLQRRIMPRVLEFASGEDMMFLFANDDVLDFYPKFGFKRASEVIFGADHEVVPAGNRLRTLSLDRPDDRALLARVSATARPVTELFGARSYGGVVLWYWTNFYPDCLHYCPERDAVLVATHDGDCLRICDVLASERLDLREYLPRVATAAAQRIEFGFTPGPWWPDAGPVADYTESRLFVRGPHEPPHTPFKFPLLAQT
jgi:GNAT superfamily N-acetyltransferase